MGSEGEGERAYEVEIVAYSVLPSISEKMSNMNV